MEKLLERCLKSGLRMTDQRRAILKVLEESDDHPSVETVCECAIEIDASISLATVYRTLGLLEELNLVVKHDFGGSSARFEMNSDHDHDHHHHLIDTETNEIIEFQDDELERITERIARDLGYEIVDHTFEIFGKKIKN